MTLAWEPPPVDLDALPPKLSRVHSWGGLGRVRVGAAVADVSGHVWHRIGIDLWVCIDAADSELENVAEVLSWTTRDMVEEGGWPLWELGCNPDNQEHDDGAELAGER